MRVLQSFATLLLIAGIILYPTLSLTFSTGAPSGRTGAPGDQTCVDGCHNQFGLNSGTGSVSISAPDTYNLGEEIVITVTVERTPSSTFGFEMTVMDGTNQHVGTLEVDVLENTEFASGDTDYVTHDNAASVANTSSWNITWTAPATDVGDITIFAAGNAANGNGNNQGDEIYTTSHTMSPAPLPVELVSFDAIADERTVSLRWETASETNNAGFEVQHQINGLFEAVGFVAGQGTTQSAQTYTHTLTNLPAGMHRFRLKQVDFDGTSTYSAAIETTLELPGLYELGAPYPNPFNPQTAFTLTVAQTQHVTLEVVDMAGRSVAVLHDGFLPAHEAHTFRFDAAGLASGSYLIHARAEDFIASRPVVLLK